MFNLKERMFVNLINKKLSHNVIKFDHEAVYHARESETCRVTSDYNIHEETSRKIIPVPDDRPSAYIQDDVKFPLCPMDDHREPKKRLIRKTLWYINEFRELKTRIGQGNFNWKNQSITKLNSSVEMASFAATTRYMIGVLMKEVEETPGVIPQICFCYCFSGIASPLSAEFSFSSILRVQWLPGVNLDLSGSDGSFVIDPTRTRLFGIVLGEDDNPKRLDFLTGMLPGFVIEDLEAGLPLIKTAQWLMDNKHEIPDGTTFRVLVGNKFMVARRDSRIDTQIMNTVERRVKAKAESALKRSMEMARQHKSKFRRKDL